jgi:hypothetical protein
LYHSHELPPIVINFERTLIEKVADELTGKSVEIVEE